MVDKSKDDTFKVADRARDDTNTGRSTDTRDFYDTIRENFIKIVDEVARVQPQVLAVDIKSPTRLHSSDQERHPHGLFCPKTPD